MLRLAPGPAKVIDSVAVGRLVVDGGKVVSPDAASIRERRRLMRNGVAFVVLVLDERGALLAEPRLSGAGLFDGETDGDLPIEAAAAVRDAVAELSPAKRGDDAAVVEAARVALRRVLKVTRKRPLIEIQVIHV